MQTLIKTATVIEAVRTKPKRIEEYVGRVNSDTEVLSIAKIVSPADWEEPRQTHNPRNTVQKHHNSKLRLL